MLPRCIRLPHTEESFIKTTTSLVDAGGTEPLATSADGVGGGAEGPIAAAAAAAASQVCGLCQKQIASYTCPRCATPYCSLGCYRGAAHASCSETFYRNSCEEVMSDVTATRDEREKMAHILRRVHEEGQRHEQAVLEASDVLDGKRNASLGEDGATGVDYEGAGDDDDDDDDDGTEEDETENVSDLASRLDGVVLDSTDEVWARLTERERKEFLRAVTDGRLAADHVGVWQPWWLPSSEPDWPALAAEHASVASREAIEATRARANPLVRFNLVDALLAYVYVMRASNGSWHEAGALACALSLTHLSAALDGSPECSSTAHDTALSAIQSCQMRAQQQPQQQLVDEGSLLPMDGLSHPLTLHGLLDDVCALLEGAPTTPTRASPILHALSDTVALLRTARTPSGGSASVRLLLRRSAHRALFLLAFAASLPAQARATLLLDTRTAQSILHTEHRDRQRDAEAVTRRPRIEVVS